MNTDSQIITPEVLPPETDGKLTKYAAQTGLEKQSTETLVEAFRPIFAKARQAIQDAAGVAASVKDATCVREIKQSRACRLALRAVRLESEEARKKHKEHALLYGRAVDGFHNILLADLSPVETALKEAEDIAERAEANRLADLKAAREAELVPLLDEPLLGNLADLSEADYMKKLNNAKLLRQAKLDAAAKVESERLAKEEAAKIERERLAVENARLQAEAVAREAAAKAEREAAEKKLAEERAAAEAKAAAEAQRIEAERAEERRKAQVEANRIAEATRKEREVEAAKAKAEAEQQAAIAAEELKKLEAQAKFEREASEKLRAELAAKAKAEAKAEAAEIARVESERKAAAAAAKKAAAAPDNAKLKALAESVRALTIPTLSDPKKQGYMTQHVEALAVWLETSAEGELL